jgi:glycerol-3-phosphate acyltransferase PlsY
MNEVKIKLSALWVSTMLTYFLGDVLRIFSGDFDRYMAGDGLQFTAGMLIGVAVIMLIPIIMVTLSVFLKYKANRRLNIIAAAFMFVFNAIGLPSYDSVYDMFLIAVSLVFNLLIVWYAWKWREQEA